MKVKYVPVASKYGNLTPGKIYDVINYTPSIIGRYEFIEILNDMGELDSYFQFYAGIPEFIDVTIEFRDETINEILK